MKGFPFYWFVLGLTFVGPFFLGFHKSLSFNQSWKSISLAILVIMTIYIPWDILFTHWEIWQFNSQFTSDTYWLRLPLEEWLFFIATPYSCIFVWRCVQYYFPNMAALDRNNSPKLSWLLLLLLLLMGGILIFRNPQGWYTTTALFAGLGLTLFHFIFNPAHFSGKILTWFILMVPFFICNGILTGIHFWEYPLINTNLESISHFVVGYNPNENAGIRIWSVPAEDFFYGMGFFWIGAGIYDFMERKSRMHKSS
jgi:lycopene cyclase domain-containing protein